MYNVATRKYAPEKTYNPTRLVRPPQVTPSRKILNPKAPLMLKVVEFEVTRKRKRQTIKK